MGKLKVGVIGLGVGKVVHIPGYNSHPEAKVVAICDNDEDRLKQVGDNYGIKQRYTNYEEMLEREKLDVVSVATPNYLHAPITIKALDAGCHVLCEKPMAMNATEAESMKSKAEEVGKRLMINFSYRFSQMSYALKSQVDSGVIGDIYFTRTIWHRRRGIMGGWFSQKDKSGGGPLMDLGVHRIDLALWLMGYPEPELVVGNTYDHVASEIGIRKRMKFDVEDLAVGLVRFQNGATLEIEASWAINQPESDFRVYWTKGKELVQKDFMETWLYGNKGGLVQRNFGGEYDFEAWLFTEENGFQFDKKLAFSRANVRSAMFHFIDSIINDTVNMATAEEGVKVMRIIDGIYKSADTGKSVNLKPRR